MTFLLYLVVALAIALITVIATALAHRRRAEWAHRIPGAAALVYLGLGVVAAVLAPSWPPAFLGFGAACLLAAGSLVAMGLFTRKIEIDGAVTLTVLAILACALLGVVMLLAGGGGLLFGIGVR